MSLAVIDEDLENLDFTTCKDRIVQLQADRERRLEATERLQEKLKALNNELAARRLEADQRRIELKEEQSRNKKRAEVQREEGGEVALVETTEEDQTKVRNFIEEMIQEKAAGPNKKAKQLSAYGFRVFDETELMVEKPTEKAGPKEQPVDTVLVTHQKPNSDDIRYHLSYRVAKDTPSKKLREDACNYWNLSEVEYILLTVENSKVHDDVILQHCFKPNERCQLILAPKDPRRQVLMDKEMEATRPKLGKGAKKAKVATTATEDPSKRANSASNFIDWMQAKPGIWEFMVQRDCNVVDHLSRIKLRSICIYILFILLSGAIFYFVKPPSKAYYMRQGPLQSMTAAHVDSETGVLAPSYDSIRTQEEAWNWLTYTVSNQLLVADSDLRQHNYLVGWLRIRMQQVEPANNKHCKPKDIAPSDTYCVVDVYSQAKPGNEDLDFIKMYWGGYNFTTTTTTTTSTTDFTSGSAGGGSSTRLLGSQDFDGGGGSATPSSSNAGSGGGGGGGGGYSEGGGGGRRLRSPFIKFLQQSGDEPYPAEDRRQDAQNNLIDADAASEDTDPEARTAAEERRLLYGMASWTDDYAYNKDEATVAGTLGRSSKVSPWKYSNIAVNAVDHEVASLAGWRQVYDPSGYNLDYDLQYNQTLSYAAYRADMMALRERGWFTNRTRAIILSFALYSSNYDLWTQNDFVLEMPVNSIVNPIRHIDVFQPSLKFTENNQIIFYLDVARLFLVVLMIFLIIKYEIGQAKKREERWFVGYICTPVGLADVSIVGIMIFIFVVRDVMLGMMYVPQDFLDGLMANEAGFMSTSARATMYRLQAQIEAPLFCLVLFRFFSFLRINRQIFIIWTTVVEAAKLYLPFCLVLLPVGLGIVVWAHSLWHNTQRHYSSIPSSFMSVLMMAHGDINVDGMFRSHRPDTLVFGVVFFVVVWLLLINAWIAVLVQCYQKTRVRAGYRPSDYNWREKHYAVWMLWRPFAKLYFRLLRPRIEKPKAFVQSADDDDD